MLWGLGKIDVMVDATANLLNTKPGVDPSSINFGDQPVNTLSPSQTITFSNGGTDPLGVGSITLTGSSFLITANTCKAYV